MYIILFIGTPKKGTPNFGKFPFRDWGLGFSMTMAQLMCCTPAGNRDKNSNMVIIVVTLRSSNSSNNRKNGNNNDSSSNSNNSRVWGPGINSGTCSRV